MRSMIIICEIVLLSALIIGARCWNHDRVFIGRDVYFTDADCYSRMSRVRLCREHPGLVVRHHDFENYPEGTVSHATAPFDYLIVALSIVASSFSSDALDVAGAWISPLLALAGGIFLWFWSYRVGFHYRWPALVLYAVSPILVHGTELGRPDHQSLLIVLVIIALCGEWMVATRPSHSWNVLTGVSWGMALWVSLYEPLILFLLAQLPSLLWRRATKAAQRSGFQSRKWLAFSVTLLIGAVVERRAPSLSFINEPFVRNWADSIGELQHVPILSSVWFEWGSLLMLVAPLAFLLWSRCRRIRADWLGRIGNLLCLLGILVILTHWQARWGYFLVAVFVVCLPGLLESIKSRVLVWTVFLLSLWPVASAWDRQLWPNDAAIGQEQEEARERIELRDLAVSIRSTETRPFLAPWWLSPELAYWSGQPGVAGSSHESLPGIVDSARLFASADPAQAEPILRRRRVAFVVSYDADRVGQTSEKILESPLNSTALCYVLDRTPSRTPEFLMLVRQNPTGKVYKVVNNR